VSDVVSFHGKLGIGEQLQYRLRNLSEGIKKEEKKGTGKISMNSKKSATRLLLI
jgi:hypothetical protein